MTLKSFGCSFVFGTELKDTVDNILPHGFSRLTWPALLAQNKKYKYISFAKPGAGNLEIADTVLSHIEHSANEFYVIQWTWIDRFNYVTDLVPDRFTFNRWKTIHPNDSNELTEYYFRNLHSQYRDKLCSLIAIKTVVSMLQSRNLPFIMTYVDDLLWETEYHYTPAISNLQAELKPIMTGFEDKSFWNWCQYHQFPIGSIGQHPLEEAHRAAFELINRYNLI